VDEAQTLPALFPVLRSVIDEVRRKNGRFFLPGSVSPDLLTNISESLAGRVGILELTPFIYSEVAGRRGMKLENLWLRGGYPDALLHANVKKRLVKAPKVYLRDSGILHYLLGIGTADQLLTSQTRGNSFEGFMIQQIARSKSCSTPVAHFISSGLTPAPKSTF
jgi:predicted AAA+ superfamily ATPase